MFLQLSAFLLPVYFIFYPAISEKAKNDFTRSLWHFTFAGFLFYGIIAIKVFVILLEYEPDLHYSLCSYN